MLDLSSNRGKGRKERCENGLGRCRRGGRGRGEKDGQGRAIFTVIRCVSGPWRELRLWLLLGHDVHENEVNVFQKDKHQRNELLRQRVDLSGLS